jgi:aspartyl-tRNA(Asn)/glutamyl-tRNA(Gln) amidotransferase subunit C
MGNKQAAGEATLDDVRHVAELAHIDLTADEQQRMLKDLNAILGHIAQLNEVNTEGIEPMAAGLPDLEAEAKSTTGSSTPSADADSGRNDSGFYDSKESLREDAVRPSLQRAPVMAEAPETDGVFFKVPKVIER